MGSPDVPFTELFLPSPSAEAEQLCLTWEILQKSKENYSARCASRQDTLKPAALLTPQPEEKWRGSDRYQALYRVTLGHPWPQKNPGYWQITLWDSCLKEY